MTRPSLPAPPTNDVLTSLLKTSHPASDPLFGTARVTPASLRDRDPKLKAMQMMLAPATQTRRKIWEFDTNLHCSIIGTCLTTAELRQILGKAGLTGLTDATEHDVHAAGVRLANKPHEGARLLHKALDRRHRLAIARFDKARGLDEVRRLWREALDQGDIPGAYWAALTHPASTASLVKEAFTDVHMLSHLVGAANRADIRRLRQLEEEKATLEAKVERQQRQLRDAVLSRDATIRDLNRALEARIAQTPVPNDTPEAGDAGWEALAGNLQQRLARCDSRRQRVERQLVEARAALAAERESRIAAEHRESALRQEIEAIETSFIDGDDPAEPVEGPAMRPGLTVLYVGGKQARIGHLRALAERGGTVFLHHDGGIEEREGKLPGLVSRADAVLFPVDCISHAAMTLIKRLCRQTDKPLMPLRSAGLAPFCAALKHPALASIREG